MCLCSFIYIGYALESKCGHKYQGNKKVNSKFFVFFCFFSSVVVYDVGVERKWNERKTVQRFTNNLSKKRLKCFLFVCVCAFASVEWFDMDFAQHLTFRIEHML